MGQKLCTPVWSPRGDYIAFTKTYKNQFFIGLIKKMVLVKEL